MTERVFPFNMDAECGVLGSLIIDPDAMAQVADSLKAEDFYRTAHQLLYEAMLTLYEQRQPADLITICDELKRRGKLEDVGGPSAVTALIHYVPTSGNVEHYSRIVQEKALARRLIGVGGEIVALAYNEDENALEAAEQKIFALGERGNASDFTPIKAVIAGCMSDLDALHSRSAPLVGVPTGFYPLDVALGGLQRSDLVIVAGRPGTGKTSFALNIAANAVYKHQMRVAVFSLEMSKKQLGVRLLSMEARVDQQRLRLGYVHDEEWERLLVAMENLSEGGIWIDDTAGLSLMALRSKARRMQAQQGVDLIVVDYLQLMHATLDGKRYANREQEIAEISRGLKGIAKELNVPVLALAQLSRAVESRQVKIPQLSDLRESGAIENEADVVLFIYREEMYEPDSEAKGTADIIIAKHRNGPVGSVRLAFEATQTRFSDL